MREAKLAKITVELPDGQIYSGAASAIDISHSMGMEPFHEIGRMLPDYVRVGPPEWRIEATGVGGLKFLPAEQYIDDIVARKTAPEYECAWCGATNLMQNRQCTQCGGFRPPITG